MIDSCNQRHVPLQFVVHGLKDGPSSKKRAKVIASHVSGTYKRWRKISATQGRLTLDSSTKAILGPQHSPVSKHSSRGSIKIEPEDDYTRTENTEGLNLDEGSDGVFTRASNEEAEADRLAAILPVTPAIFGTQSLDPFTPFHQQIDHKIEPHLRFYFKVILPFARHLLSSWSWLDNVPRIQATPVLAYAVSTYASVFLSGCLGGAPNVVLPPPTHNGQGGLWPIPHWVSLHTKCVSELSAIIKTGDPSQTEAVYQSVLLLFRLSVLLADGGAARMHFKALLSLAVQTNRDPGILKAELGVLRDNIVGAFLHYDSVVIVTTRRPKDGESAREVVKMERSPKWRARDWHNRQALLVGRMLVWNEASPSSEIRSDSIAAISRMDPDYGPSDREQMLEFCRCYQIALYLLVYLNAINADASAPNVRSNLLNLQERLSRMELVSVVSQWNCTFFNMLMVGAMASRALPERVWFVQLLADWYLEVRFLDDVWELMAQFIDPFVIVPSVLEEIWHDVLATRFPQNSETTLNLYRKDVIKLEDADQGRPFTRSPKIDGPRKIVDEEI